MPDQPSPTGVAVPASAPDFNDAISSPQLSDAELAEMAPFGTEQSVAVGHVLFEAGEATGDLFVVLEGAVEVVRSAGKDEAVVAVFGAGTFIGELTLLTGQRRFLTARVSQAGRVLAIEQPEFRRLMSLRPALAETIFNALVARREILRSGEGAQAIRIIGSRYSPEAMSLRSFAEHSRLAHTWIDVEDAEDIDALLAPMGLRRQDTPVVITPTEILRRPSTATLAEHLGLTFQSTPGLHLRSCRCRHRSGRPCSSCLRSVGGPAHGLAGRRRDRRASRRELANRELRGVSKRDLGRRSHRESRGPGDAARSSAERTL